MPNSDIMKVSDTMEDSDAMDKVTKVSDTMEDSGAMDTVTIEDEVTTHDRPTGSQTQATLRDRWDECYCICIICVICSF